MNRFQEAVILERTQNAFARGVRWGFLYGSIFGVIVCCFIYAAAGNLL